MHNHDEDKMIRRLERRRRQQAEAEEQQQQAEVRLATARRTWQELCHGNRVHDIALFRKAAEAFLLASEGRHGAGDIMDRARELVADED